MHDPVRNISYLLHNTKPIPSSLFRALGLQTWFQTSFKNYFFLLLLVVALAFYNCIIIAVLLLYCLFLLFDFIRQYFCVALAFH